MIVTREKQKQQQCELENIVLCLGVGVRDGHVNSNHDNNNCSKNIAYLLHLDDPHSARSRPWQPGEEFCVGKWYRRHQQDGHGHHVKRYKRIEDVVPTKVIAQAQQNGGHSGAEKTIIELVLPVFFAPDFTQIQAELAGNGNAIRFKQQQNSTISASCIPLCPLFGPECADEVLPAIRLVYNDDSSFVFVPAELYSLKINLSYKFDFPDWTLQNISGKPKPWNHLEYPVVNQLCAESRERGLVVEQLAIVNNGNGNKQLQFCALLNKQAELAVGVYPPGRFARIGQFRDYWPIKLESTYSFPVCIALDCPQQSEQIVGVNSVDENELEIQLWKDHADRFQLALTYVQSPFGYKVGDSYFLPWLGKLMDPLERIEEAIGIPVGNKETVCLTVSLQYSLAKRKVAWSIEAIPPSPPNKSNNKNPQKSLVEAMASPPIASNIGQGSSSSVVTNGSISNSSSGRDSNDNKANNKNEEEESIVVDIGDSNAVDSNTVDSIEMDLDSISPLTTSTTSANNHSLMGSGRSSNCYVANSSRNSASNSPSQRCGQNGVVVTGVVASRERSSDSNDYADEFKSADSNHQHQALIHQNLIAPKLNKKKEEEATVLAIPKPLDVGLEHKSAIATFMTDQSMRGEAVFLFWDVRSGRFVRKCFAQFHWKLNFAPQNYGEWFELRYIDLVHSTSQIVVFDFALITQRVQGQRVRSGACAQYPYSTHRDKFVTVWHKVCSFEECGNSYYTDKGWWPWLCKHCFPGLPDDDGRGSVEQPSKLDVSSSSIDCGKDDLADQIENYLGFTNASPNKAVGGNYNESGTRYEKIVRSNYEKIVRTSPPKSSSSVKKMITSSPSSVKKTTSPKEAVGEQQQTSSSSSRTGTGSSSAGPSPLKPKSPPGLQQQKSPPTTTVSSKPSSTPSSSPSSGSVATALAVLLAVRDGGDSVFLLFDDVKANAFTCRVYGEHPDRITGFPRVGRWYRMEYKKVAPAALSNGQNIDVLSVCQLLGVGEVPVPTRVVNGLAQFNTPRRAPFMRHWHNMRQQHKKSAAFQGPWWPEWCQKCWKGGVEKDEEKKKDDDAKKKKGSPSTVKWTKTANPDDYSSDSEVSDSDTVSTVKATATTKSVGLQQQVFPLISRIRRENVSNLTHQMNSLSDLIYEPPPLPATIPADAPTPPVLLPELSLNADSDSEDASVDPAEEAMKRAVAKAMTATRTATKSASFQQSSSSGRNGLAMSNSIFADLDLSDFDTPTTPKPVATAAATLSSSVPVSNNNIAQHRSTTTTMPTMLVVAEEYQAKEVASATNGMKMMSLPSSKSVGKEEEEEVYQKQKSGEKKHVSNFNGTSRISNNNSPAESTQRGAATAAERANEEGASSSASSTPLSAPQIRNNNDNDGEPELDGGFGAARIRRQNLYYAASSSSRARNGNAVANNA